jgi:hypothetical protein
LRGHVPQLSNRMFRKNERRFHKPAIFFDGLCGRAIALSKAEPRRRHDARRFVTVTAT